MKKITLIVTLLIFTNLNAMIYDAFDGPNDHGDYQTFIPYMYMLLTTTVISIPTAVIINGKVDFSDEETLSFIELQASSTLNGESIAKGENIIEGLATAFETSEIELSEAILEIIENGNEISIEALEERFNTKIPRKQ